MGTRYNIKNSDAKILIEKGLAVVIKDNFYDYQGPMEYDEYLDDYTPATMKEGWTVSIAGWAFDGGLQFIHPLERDPERWVVGPNWGKDELDELFQKAGIKPEYY